MPSKQINAAVSQVNSQTQSQRATSTSIPSKKQQQRSVKARNASVKGDRDIAMINNAAGRSRKTATGGAGVGKREREEDDEIEMDDVDEVDSGDDHIGSNELEQTKRLLKSLLDKKEKSDKVKLESLKKKLEGLFKESTNASSKMVQSRLIDSNRLVKERSLDSRMIDGSPLTAEYIFAVIERQAGVIVPLIDANDELFKVDNGPEDHFWNQATQAYERRSIEIKKQYKKLQRNTKHQANEMIAMAELHLQAAVISAKNMKWTLKATAD